MAGISIELGIGKDGASHEVINEKMAYNTERMFKGKSVIEFPKDYTIIDIETTGLSPKWDEIIELAAVRYENGIKTAEYTTLVHPQNAVDEYITGLTGITNDMLDDAPSIEVSIAQFADFVGQDILVGYNVNFDINFIYDSMIEHLAKPLKNNFIDVMRIARKSLTDLKHYRQIDVAEFFNINFNNSHRALYDCEVCYNCLCAIKEHIITGGKTLDSFCNSFKSSSWKTSVHACNIFAKTNTFDESHTLYKKICVFTGTLEKMTRAEAMQIVADFGGIPADGVTKKTNYLVIGNNDYCKTIKDGKSNKQKKAEKLILDGAELQVISEQVFYDMLTDY